MIVGHETQREGLKRLIERRTLPSAIMFSGMPGIGKKLVALEASRTLVCDRNQDKDKPIRFGGCGECKTCHVFGAGNYPDLHLVDSRSWPIEELRELLYSLNLNSFCARSRIVVFDNSEHLSLQACNALLKTFEEPRAGTHFFLLTTNPSRIPPTLRSRCQVWFFSSLREQDVDRILRERAPEMPEQERRDLSALADGSLEDLENLRDERERFGRLSEGIEGIMRGDTALAVRVAGELAKDKEGLHGSLRLLRIIVRRKIRHAGSDEEASVAGILLENILAAERLITERNLAPSAVIATALLSTHSFTRSLNGASLLDRICL